MLLFVALSFSLFFFFLADDLKSDFCNVSEGTLLWSRRIYCYKWQSPAGLLVLHYMTGFHGQHYVYDFIAFLVQGFSKRHAGPLECPWSSVPHHLRYLSWKSCFVTLLRLI